MEYEEMKRTWDTLTHRLEKQEIVSRRLLQQTVDRRRGGIRNYQLLSLAVTIACLPIFVTVSFQKHFPPIFGLTGSLLILGGISYYCITITKLKTAEGRTLTAQVLGMLRFRHRMMICTTVLYSIVFIWLAVLIICMYKPLVASGRLHAVLVAVAGGLVLGIAEIRWTLGRITDLVQSIRELQEFDEN